MPSKTKTFDCVEMKRTIQKKLMLEYEAGRGRYSSFGAFINARAAKSGFARQMRAKIARSGSGVTAKV